MIKVVGSLEFENRGFERAGMEFEEELLLKLRTLVILGIYE